MKITQVLVLGASMIAISAGVAVAQGAGANASGQAAQSQVRQDGSVETRRSVERQARWRDRDGDGVRDYRWRDRDGDGRWDRSWRDRRYGSYEGRRDNSWYAPNGGLVFWPFAPFAAYEEPYEGPLVFEVAPRRWEEPRHWNGANERSRSIVNPARGANSGK